MDSLENIQLKKVDNKHVKLDIKLNKLAFGRKPFINRYDLETDDNILYFLGEFTNSMYY